MPDKVTNEYGEQVDLPEQRDYEPIEPEEEDTAEPYREYEEIRPTPKGPHFDIVEAFFFLALSLIKDIFDLTWILGAALSLVLVLWMFLKGVKAVKASSIAMFVDDIPVLGVLPITFVAACLTVWHTNWPDSFYKTFGIFSKILTKKKGK